MEVAAHLPTAVPCFSSPQQVLCTRADLAVLLMRGASSVARKIEKKTMQAMERNKRNAGAGGGMRGTRRRIRNMPVEQLKVMLKPGKVSEAMMPSFEE